MERIYNPQTDIIIWFDNGSAIEWRDVTVYNRHHFQKWILAYVNREIRDSLTNWGIDKQITIGKE